MQTPQVVALKSAGSSGTYRIEAPLSGARSSLVTEKEFRWLRIPRRILDEVPLDFKTILIELDYRTETILRKAYVLADDWRIDSTKNSSRN